ncbi:MAG: HD domain-containing protein [Acidobacteria bacterium]|nr:HD domain-containing protein [Acidobacteriota bacterium]
MANLPETILGDLTGLNDAVESDLRRQVELANRQLHRYAAELRQLAQRETEKALELAKVNEQLRTYSKELQELVEQEKQRARDLENAYVESLARLTQASAYRDNETGEHIQRLSHYSRLLALTAGSPSEFADLVFLAAPMHDVGKIGIPDHVLYKPGPLNDQEWAIMKRHPIIGATLLEGSRSELIQSAHEIALAHHERWDGTGYPYSLQGEQIPFSARIVAVGDTYDALRSVRPYKYGYSHELACQIMTEGDDRTRPEHFDPQLLDAFRRCHSSFADIYEAIREPRSYT